MTLWLKRFYQKENPAGHFNINSSSLYSINNFHFSKPCFGRCCHRYVFNTFSISSCCKSTLGSPQVSVSLLPICANSVSECFNFHFDCNRHRSPQSDFKSPSSEVVEARIENCYCGHLGCSFHFIASH